MRGTRPGINYVFLVKWIASRGVIEVTWRLSSPETALYGKVIRIRYAGLVMGYRLFEQ
ncbi:hypothetical protein HFO61_33730 [Rhizobium leguminosarum]|uniref:hypothetical protein n=1 Tax=Rhizobium leguminosarum TaxID=384 RepID=UPI001A92A2E4|nr:hypothetical protein [Rhizobium leguminosarum]MBY5413455.1 hypothetical protein [Rhizobium leguminosarum]MBY5551680.1 hypothetical protein [Rhizobium leguminosarum]MBY5558655.1 hypothetical protein [Rhizobium leguminosarum]QSW27809.1 hypothetical protein J0664_32100 [Rhizobium leguminosarum]